MFILTRKKHNLLPPLAATTPCPAKPPNPQKYVVVVPILLFNDRTSKRNDIESVEPTNERHFYFRRVNAFVVRGEALRFLIVLLLLSLTMEQLDEERKEETVKLAGRERFKFNLLFPLRNRHSHCQRHG